MKNVLLKGGPGTGKTVFARAIAYYVGCCGDPIENVFSKNILADRTAIDAYVDSDYVEFIQVHASMTYEDIVYGIEVNYSGTLTMAYAEKRIKKICDRAAADTNKYFIILDDIERANASHLLGNLLYAMEYRNDPVTLCDGNTLIIPDNVIIIITECKNLYGTPLEYALRRRFDYEKELYSSNKVIDDYYSTCLSAGAKTIVLNIYETVRNFVCSNYVEEKAGDSDKYIPGHGMFLVSQNGSDGDILTRIKNRFIYQIFPYITELVREGVLLSTDTDLENLNSSILAQISVGIPATGARGSVDKILVNTRTIVPFFSLADSYNYYINTVIPGGCKEHRAIIENITDAILKNGVLTIDKAMSDIFLNTNVVKFQHRTRVGTYAAFLVEAAHNDDYGYLTTVSRNLRSYYSSNPCRTGRWAVYNDAPAYDVTYSNGVTVEYIALNAFRNSGSDTTSQVIHAKDNTASIYSALYRLVETYLSTCETEYALRASSDASYVDIYNLAKLEKEYWQMVNVEAQALRGADNKLIRLGTAVKNLQLLWNAVGTIINVDDTKFNNLITGATANTALNYEDLYNITGIPKDIELKGVKAMVDLKDYQKIMENIGVHQMVFQGPPGTSKTFESKKFVLKQLNPGSTVFAPGTDVTQALISSELGGYKLTAADYANPVSSAKLTTGGWDIVQFHPSYGYEDFIRGIEVKPVGGVPTYASVNRVLGKIAEFAKIAENNTAAGCDVPKFYLLVDEINRANLATVFGELIYGLEYRDSKVSTPYEVDDRISGTPGAKTNDIVLGKNLFIVGTMNTADKSIDSIDYAIRRRFIFIDCPAQRDTVISRYQTVKGTGAGDEDSIELLLFDAVETIFDDNRFFNEEYQRNDVRIGHTYFLRSSATHYLDEMIERFVFQVVPILREYIKDGILDSYEDLKSIEHTPSEILTAGHADRPKMLGENIMLYVKHFGEKNGAGVKTIDNEYIAQAIEDVCTTLGY